MNVFNEITVPFNLEIFNFINHGLQNSFFDFIFPRITDLAQENSIMLFCLLILIIGAIFRNKKIIFVSVLAFLTLFIDLYILNILKAYFAQARPFAVLDNVHLLLDLNKVSSAAYSSFPSGHASNIFGFATAVGVNIDLKIKGKVFKSGWILFPIAILLAIVRVYIGVHWPFDILIGAILGILTALILTTVFKLVLRKFSIEF
ncbi:MAG: phosphatase PAP2 family protein [Methanobrevibacter sp.]|jgi:undecaprenyl-diphosphatase|nr:phosphatase PAP2 family protein [Candidatus Methanoflexus mossambicus]